MNRLSTDGNVKVFLVKNGLIQEVNPENNHRVISNLSLLFHKHKRLGLYQKIRVFQGVAYKQIWSVENSADLNVLFTLQKMTFLIQCTTCHKAFIDVSNRFYCCNIKLGKRISRNGVKRKVMPVIHRC
jgi:hypothetical protein